MGTQKSDKSTPKSFFYLFLTLGAAILAAIDAGWLQKPLINNGDYWRLIGNITVVETGQGWNNCQKINFSPAIPTSTGDALFTINAGIHYLIGTCMHFQAHGIMMTAILLIGVLYLWLHGHLDLKNSLTLSITSITFSPILFSHYQESVAVALLPWCMLAINIVWTRRKSALFLTISSLTIAVKAQMALFLPAALSFLAIAKFKNKLILKTTLIAATAITMSSILMIVLAKRYHSDANGYNRLFNGIGWTLQDVTEWPARSFRERHSYFAANKEQLQQRSKSYEAPHNHKLMGTSYWPDGEKIKETKDWPTVAPLLHTSYWLGKLTGAPSLALDWTLTAWEVTLKSSYTLSYISPPPKSETPLHHIRAFTLSNAGWLWLASILYLISTSAVRRSYLPICLASWVALMPLLVVAGDGFFEFEKHMLTYMIFVPLFLMTVQSKNQSTQIEKHRK